MYRVLIADDEAYIRSGLKSFVDWPALGCELAGEAADGVEALRLADELAPDILLSDIRMPGLDGLDLCAAMQRSHPHTQLILLTGYPDFEYARRAIGCGVTGFVLKPTTAQQITEAVRKATARLAQSGGRRDAERALMEQQTQNLLLQQNSFLQRVLNAEHFSSLFVLSELSALSLQLQNYALLEIRVHAEDWESPAITEDLARIRDALRAAFAGFDTRFLDASDHRFFLFVSAPEDGAPLVPAILTRCRELVHAAENFSSLRLFIGVSRLHPDLLSLQQAKAEAGRAASFASYAEGSAAYSEESLPDIPAAQFGAVRELLHAFEYAVLQLDFSACRDASARLIAYIRTEQLPFAQAQHLVQLACMACVQRIWTYRPEVFAAGDRSAAESAAYACRTLGELEAVLRGATEEAEACLSQPGEDAVSAIRLTRTYISGHLSEELTLEALAARVHFSPSYLSRLFKRETGQNLTAYIQSERIARAKELLLTTDLHFYEIAESVGIGNPIYFSKLFKKLTGQQPKEFKEQHQSPQTSP